MLDILIVVILIVPSVAALLFAFSCFYAFVLTQLWHWFVVYPALFAGAHDLTGGQAYGLMLAFGMFRPSLWPVSKNDLRELLGKEKTTWQQGEPCVAALSRPFFYWGIGYLIFRYFVFKG